MFYGQCNKCGERWGLGTVPTCTCPDEALEQPAQQCKDCEGMGMRDGVGEPCGKCNGSGEQPAQQEPVAVVSGYYGGQCVILPIDPARVFNSNTALYTSPPAQRTWVGLTDEEVDDAARYCVKSGQSVNAAIRAIEAKLREKNGGQA